MNKIHQIGSDYDVVDMGHDTPCWLSRRGLNSDGYACLYEGGKQHQAHRFYYERENGQIPDGLELDHLCSVRACVRPDHLEPVTHLENIRRGRRTKLTADQVREIRRSSKSTLVLSRRYGVNRQSISNVRTFTTWKEVAA